MNRNIRTANFRNYIKYFEQINRELRLQLKKWDADSIRNSFKLFGSFLAKETSPIFAMRACRSYQILQLHSKLWTSQATSLTTGTTLKVNSRRWFLGLVFISLCDQKVFNKQKEDVEADVTPARDGGAILRSELVEHLKDLDYIHHLTSATVVCPDCKDRLVIDKKHANVKYCHCPNSPTTVYNRKIEDLPWVPFVETPDLLIWRKPHESKPGMFVYKVYGYYDDISPVDFLETQLDLNYRKKWDNSVRKLEIVESDEKNHVDIVHWEMQWPRMFSNRDYSFARRHLIDESDGTMVIMSKAVVHAKVPETSGVVRVHEYWSVMHIKGMNGLDKPGVEFGLTYYDNPGLSLPAWMLNWAAMTAIPDFLNKIRIAARSKKKVEGRKIYLSHAHSCEPIPCENSALAVNQSSARNSEILSQFFKENILEPSLNEVEV